MKAVCVALVLLGMVAAVSAASLTVGIYTDSACTKLADLSAAKQTNPCTSTINGCYLDNGVNSCSTDTAAAKTCGVTGTPDCTYETLTCTATSATTNTYAKTDSACKTSLGNATFPVGTCTTLGSTYMKATCSSAATVSVSVMAVVVAVLAIFFQ